MITLKRRSWSNKGFLFLLIMTMLMGITACSGKANSTADSDSAKVETLKNRQSVVKETQEAQPTHTPTPDTSLADTEKSQFISGVCGDNAVWIYDTTSKQLKITGMGVVDQIIKKSKKYVSDYGYKKRYQVKEIKVEEGITALDAGPLFINISKAKGVREIKLSLPDSLEKIGADTFDPGQNDANYIRHIHLPSKVRYVEGGAFWGLGDEAVPQVNSYQEDVKIMFQNDKEKLKITVDSENPYYTIKDGVLFTKDIKTLVYYPSEKIDKVYCIPKSVTKIKALAFARNSFLCEVVLPKGLKEIGAGAFFDDHRLTKVNLNQARKVKRIRDFDGIKNKICHYNTGVPAGIALETVEESDERYHDPTEYRKEFYGSDKVRKASYFLGTFAGTNLKEVQFSNHLKYVSYNTFENCLHLKKIYIGKSFAGEINSDCIGDTKGFSLPDELALEIQVSAKNKHYKVMNHILYSKDGKTVYKALKSYFDSTLTLDKRVQKIAKGAFCGSFAGKLRKVVVLGNLKQISREAFAGSSIKSFEVHGSVDTIGIEAFFRCSKLKRFVCHGSVKHIGAQAFYYAVNLKKLSLGKNIKSIGKDAFEGCRWIKKLHVKQA